MLATWLDFVLWSLAVWRLAHLLVYEDGPWAICARLRLRAGIGYVVSQDANGQPISLRVANGVLAEALTCVWCLSVWCAVGLLWLWSWPVTREFALTIRVILAVSAGASILHEGVERLKHGAG
jgi:hypothetical protein